MNLGPLNYKSSILTAQPPWMTFTLWGEWSEVKCKKMKEKKFWKNFEISWLWLVSYVTLWIILQCIFKKFATFYKKRPGFFSPFVPSVTWSQFCSGALSGAGYSELILLFLEPAFLRHFSAHVLSLNMHSK